jgi:hypothetical protein
MAEANVVAAEARRPLIKGAIGEGKENVDGCAAEPYLGRLRSALARPFD